MDITYRPYIRDSALKEVSFKSPVVNITGYTPKYTTDDIKEEPAQAVESQIEEIKAPKVNTSIPATSDKSISFKSKKEFKDTMTPLYESMLVKRGLNPAFAKALVAQDGLESSWGSKPAGNFNFGGIKGKGSVKKTREVINGKDIYINDSFRDFNSLEDYVNYKIDLLNNNRYKAFSGDLNEFADRVHRGGYATDPNYSKVLNNIIASAKQGGVLKFQEGGLLEGKEWVKRWYLNRRPKIKQNIVQNQKIPVPVTGTFGYNVLAHNMRLTTAKVDPEKVPADASGVYYPWGRRIFLKEDSPSSAVHEWTHSSRPDPQVREIDKIKNVLGDTIYDQKSVIPDEYLDDSQEVYSRLMQLRHALGIDPDHEFTNEEIEALKKDHTKYQSLNSILRGNNKNKISTTIFDKDNNVIQTEPFSPEYKMSPEESTSHTEYDNDKTFNLLNRYSTDFLRRLLNDVAQVPSEKKEGTLYAQLGMKIPKYQEPWRVLPDQMYQDSPNTSIIPKKELNSDSYQTDSIHNEALNTFNNINTYWKNEGGPELDQNDFITGYKDLRNYGFSKDYTNAILANWFQESKFQSNVSYKGAKYIPQFRKSRLADYESFLSKNNLSDGITTAVKHLISKYDSERQYWEKNDLYNNQYKTIRNKFAEITGSDSYNYYISGKGNYDINDLDNFNNWLKQNNLQDFKLDGIQSVPREEDTFGAFIKMIKDKKLSIKHYDPSTYIKGIESVQQFHDWYEAAGNDANIPLRQKYWKILMYGQQ